MLPATDVRLFQTTRMLHCTVFNNSSILHMAATRPAAAPMLQLMRYEDLTEEEEEEEFYKLRPANKTDHLCQSWQYCHMFMKFRQSIT